MIEFEKAYASVLHHSVDFGVESISLQESLGRILRENWYTDRDLPPYDRVTMDGIAFRYDESIKVNSELVIAGVAAAGTRQMTLINKNSCLEIMTGAILPKGADTVIRYEDLDIKNGRATLKSTYKPFQNIHKQGEDREVGDIVAKNGIQISTPEIGIGASIGKSSVTVSKLPKTLIISTGNELIDIDKTPEIHQIRRSNSYQIKAILKSYLIESKTIHLNDEYETIIKVLGQAIRDYDLVILSGGVSKGKFDYIPEALDKLGVKKHFHKVKQRPGKPFWFGQHQENCTFFALPGNPISSFMCTYIYIISWVEKSLGLASETKSYAILDEDVNFKPDLTYFLEVKLNFSETGQHIATPCRGNGSGDLANLGNADAFIQLPKGKDLFKKGEVYRIHKFRI